MCYGCWADALNWIVLLAVLAAVLAIVALIIKRSGNARSRTMGVRTALAFRCKGGGPFVACTWIMMGAHLREVGAGGGSFLAACRGDG